MILVNSCPKAGSHAFAALLDRAGAKRCPGTILGCTPDQPPHVSGVSAITLATLRLLPDSVYMIGHVCAHHADVLEGISSVTVIRDPRNCLISYQRHRLRTDYLTITTAEALADYWGAPFVETYRGFLAWQGRAAIVRFEDLPEHVVGDGSGIYSGEDARWNTRTGSLSNYVEQWRREDWRAWHAVGGPELAVEAGYS